MNKKYLTREKLSKNILKAKNYIIKNKKLGKKSKFHMAIQSVIRTSYYIDWNHSLNILNPKNIDFFTINNDSTHWAETDGVNIWLSPLKEWNDHNLYYTLLHESLHGLVKRSLYNSYISEEHEHLFMLKLDPWLIKNKC